MHLAVTLADAVEPRVNRLVVELNRVVGRRNELVTIEVSDDASLPSCPDRLFAGLTPSENLHMDHIVLLRPQLRIIVST